MGELAVFEHRGRINSKQFSELKEVYERQFNGFKRELKQNLSVPERIRALNRLKYGKHIVTSSFESICALYSVLNATQTYELGIEYLTLPALWQGPLEMDCVTTFHEARLLAMFYGHSVRMKFKQDEAKKALENIGLLKGAGITVITRGNDHQTRFIADIPYFRMHSHPNSQPEPSGSDTLAQMTAFNNYHFVIGMPIELPKLPENCVKVLNPKKLSCYRPEDERVPREHYIASYIPAQKAEELENSGLVDLIEQPEARICISKDIKKIWFRDTRACTYLVSSCDRKKAIAALRKQQMTFDVHTTGLTEKGPEEQIVFTMWPFPMQNL